MKLSRSSRLGPQFRKEILQVLFSTSQSIQFGDENGVKFILARVGSYGFHYGLPEYSAFTLKREQFSFQARGWPFRRTMSGLGCCEHAHRGAFTHFPT